MVSIELPLRAMFSSHAGSTERGSPKQYYHTIEVSFLKQMITMEDFGGKLKSLGLSQYEKSLIDNGFEDWRTILDITEQDLVEMGFKLGHRRLLQREIFRFRSCSSSQSKTSETRQSSRSGSRDTPLTSSKSPNSDKRNKRRYRWHPRPDPNAPKRPKTAYVQFADQLRAQYVS
jgi:hypothetical protein